MIWVLGKTVQVLSYLLAMKESGQCLPSLIVCPASLVLNWQEECQKFTPQLSCVAVDGDAAHRAELAKQWAEADLVVTSYDLMRRDEELYSGQQFYACILDEAQAIKNHTTQKYKAVCGVNSKVRFALTGTPVENRLGELWSIFSFLMPGYLPPYKTFCARFEKPIRAGGRQRRTAPFEPAHRAVHPAAHEVRGAQRAAPQDRESPPYRAGRAATQALPCRCGGRAGKAARCKAGG